MRASLARMFNSLSIGFFILLFKGIDCTQWDPLPEEIRSAISSNHLSELSSPGFEEYHGLRKEIRGDFGIKSKLVEAATKNPEYTGANTFVIPLYIPQGAIPLVNNERSTRSGKGSIGVTTNVRRILVGRLSMDGSHKSIPIRRIIGRRPFGSRSPITRRPIPDPLLHDTVKAKIIKHTRRRPHISRGTTREENATSSIRLPSSSSPIAPHEVTKIKKIMTELIEKADEDGKTDSTTPKLLSTVIVRKLDTDMSPSKETTSTVSYKRRRKITPADIIDKRILSTVVKGINLSKEIKRITTPIPSSSSPLVKSSTVSQNNKRRRKPLSKQDKDRERTIVKPVMPSPRAKIFATTESSINVRPLTTNNTKPHRRGSSALKDLRNRRRRLNKERHQNTLKNSKKSIEETTESIIDRVLNSANKQQDVSENIVNITDAVLTSTSPTTTTTESTTQKLKTDPSTESPKSSTSEPSAALASSSFNSTQLVTSRAKEPISRKPIVSNPKRILSRRPEVFITRANEHAYKHIFSTNTINTSTPKLSTVNPILNIVNKTTESPKTTTMVSTSPKPESTTTTTEGSSLFPNNKFPPEDIVLQKLSELMKNASIGTKDSLSDIASQLDKLNEELATLGIQITNAEFNGHVFKLIDQTQSNRTNGNFSEAITKRYTIRNTTGIDNFRDSTFSVAEHNKENPTTFRTTERSFFTLKHPENLSRKTFASLTIPDVEVEKSYTNVSKIFETTIDEDSEIHLPVTIKTKVNKDYSDGTVISPSTIVPSREATRTRSTIIPISTEELNYPETLFNPKDSVTIKSNLINPTSHLRPSSTSIDTTTTIKTAIDFPHHATARFFPTAVNNEENQIIYNDNTVLKVHNATIFPSEYDGIQKLKNEVQESGSYIYFIAILGVIPCTAALVFLYRQRYKRKQKALPEREERADGFTPPTQHSRSTCHNNTLDAFPGYIFKSTERESPWEMTRSKLRITSIIGEGNFGIVWKAEVRNLCEWEEDGGPTVLVAVKGVKEDAGLKEKTDLLRELAIMKVIGQHNNIVTLLGCCTKQEPYYLVMEYIMFGKLLEFLREQRSKNNYYNFSSDTDHLTSRDLTKFASQIATGCEYLQSRGIIHRDLAARNILVDHNKICKIADFGLARSVKDTDDDIYEQKSKGPLPIRWMAPESTYMNIYTHKSDVWSFGILCWEIVTLGSTPYPGISAREVMRRVREGYRLERPEHCRPEFYEIVTKCWTQEIASRVSFTTIREELRDLLDKSSGWIDLENFEEATYYSMHQNNEEKL